MFDLVPMAFIRSHPAKLVHVPLHLTEAGDVAPQEYQIVCSCGWTSDVSHSQTFISSQRQDHVFNAWQASRDQKT